ncbi:MAG: hypothetical protein M3Z92_01800 [Bacteroidota bacterium]|nr:hypothetical protein [Bacteroidota bacterium]
MKKIFPAALPLLLILISLQACNKDHVHSSKQVTIDTTVAYGSLYQLDLAKYGDQDDVATITKQASHFSTSAITNTSGTFNAVYNYISSGDSKLASTDQVILAVTEGKRQNGNCNHHGDSTLITINFNVK